MMDSTPTAGQNMTAGASRKILEPEPMPTNIRSTQPGGGTIQGLELAWGKLRRWYLKSFRSEYAQYMKSSLKGDPSTCPVEVVDSRDLKFYRNIADCYFEAKDDPFKGRDNWPLARAGFAELVVFNSFFGCLTLLCAFGLPSPWNWFWVAPFALFVFVFSFFRTPKRIVPTGDGVVVSPADGTVYDITDEPNSDVLGEPAVKIGIFLSVFNVHVNRCSMRGKVIRLRYFPGKFFNAMKEIASRENERLELLLQQPEAPYRPFIIRQVSGAIARRIVCEVRPGQIVQAGEQFGMIKFGSRTELVLPKEGLQLNVGVGDTVKGGSTLMAQYQS